MIKLDQAVTILEQALNVAAKAGAFTLQDSAAVFNALAVVKQACAPAKDEVVETQEQSE